jgi:hypothetical protein
MTTLTLQETMDRLLHLIQAGYPAIYIVSHEEGRVLDYLARLFRVIKAQQRQKHFLRWYEGQGLQEILDIEPYSVAPGQEINWLNMEGLPVRPRTQSQGNQLATAALTSIGQATVLSYALLGDSLTVFFDVHPYLQGLAGVGAQAPLVRPLRNAVEGLRQYYDANRAVSMRPYKTIIIVAPSASGLSMELERDLIVMDFPLPDTAELARVLDDRVNRGIVKLPVEVAPKDKLALCGEDASDEKYRERLCDLVAGAGRGLTLEDYKLGLNLIAGDGHPLHSGDIESLLHLKAKAINNPALQYTPHVNIELGGMERITAWIKTRRGPAVSETLRQRYHLPPPRGVLLCGVSGGGKSQLAKLIAKEFNLALLRLDVGALFGMYVGESEERTRLALQMAEVLAPVVLWIDEVDKAFQGMGGVGDNGVSARVLGHILTWLAEKQGTIFVVATANDFTHLLKQFPEFERKGRFDEIFWVGLPSEAARAKIFEIYLAPRVKAGYLQIDENEIAAFCQETGLPSVALGEPADIGLYRLLASPQISGNMTGAEIQYAVDEMLYTLYNQAEGTMGTVSPTRLVLETTREAMGRALYTAAGDNFPKLQEWERIARANQWLWAE